MELQNLFRDRYVQKLRQSVIDGSLIKYYESDAFLYDKNEVVQSPYIYKPEVVEFKYPVENDNYDFENAVAIFKAYPTLTLLQASDIRLWTYLSHVDFYQYMSIRWPGIKNNSAENKSKYILDHWFITSPIQSNFLRHGIAGLWWGAYLSYDETRTEPFELTKVLFKQLDFATRTLGTYYLSRHKEAVIGILEYILQNPELFKTHFEPKTRFMTKHINQIGGTKPVSFFKRDYFKSALHSVKSKIEVTKR